MSSFKNGENLDINKSIGKAIKTLNNDSPTRLIESKSIRLNKE